MLSRLIREYLAVNGRRGGQSTSEAKRIAAAANGRRGGRPPKKRRKTRKSNVERDRTANITGQRSAAREETK